MSCLWNISICMYAGEATKQQSRAVSAGLWGTWRKQETTGGFSCVDLNSIFMEDCDNGPDHANMIVVVLQNTVYNMQLLKLCVVGRRVRGDDWAVAEEWRNETSTQRPSHGAPGTVSDWGTAITFLYYTLNTYFYTSVVTCVTFPNLACWLTRLYRSPRSLTHLAATARVSHAPPDKLLGRHCTRAYIRIGKRVLHTRNWLGMKG